MSGSLNPLLSLVSYHPTFTFEKEGSSVTDLKHFITFYPPKVQESRKSHFSYTLTLPMRFVSNLLSRILLSYSCSFFIWLLALSESRCNQWTSEVAQSCLTLCDPMDCSLPGFSVHGIFQARVPEWVAIFFSSGSSWPRDQTQVSHIAGRCFTIWATREA